MTDLSLSLPPAFCKALEQSSPDLLRSVLQTVIQELMSAEADARCGAPYGERSSERVNARNGYRQDQWPEGINYHWIITERYDGCRHNVWKWTDPFSTGGGTLTKQADLNLCTATGVTAGMPINVPQSGGQPVQANDWRTHSTHYRAGSLWTTQTIACNPGSGTVNCVRWARIDPFANTVVEAGVFGSNSIHRFFPSVAVNFCNDLGVGYSRGSSSSFPSAYVTGRLATDPPGTLQTEAVLKDGEVVYTCFDAAPRRWGDYSGMTIDPDGSRFWYLGEYSRNQTGSCRWGTYIGSFMFSSCDLIFANGFETFGGFPLWSACSGPGCP